MVHIISALGLWRQVLTGHITKGRQVDIPQSENIKYGRH